MRIFKKPFLKTLCVFIVLCLAVSLVSCKEKDIKNDYATHLMAGATAMNDKTYSVTVVTEEESLTFTDVDNANYGMEVVDPYSASKVRDIAQFSIAKKSDTELNITFTDTDYLAEGQSFRFYSTSPVLSNKSKLDCLIYLQSVSYGLSSDISEFNRYDSNIVLTISLTDGTLTDTLSKEDINVSGALQDKEYTLKRVDDTTFSLTYVDAFKDDVSDISTATVTLLAKAIKGNTPFDVSIDFSVITPNAYIDNSAMQFISVEDGTKIIVPVIFDNNFVITTNPSDMSVTGVSGFTVEKIDLAGDNFMLVTLKTALNREESIIRLDVASLLIKERAVNLGGQKGSIPFGNFNSALSVTALCDYTEQGFNGYVLDIDVINGTFKNYNTITANDIKIKGADGKSYNFTLTSKSEKTLVATVKTTDTAFTGTVSMDSSRINSTFGLMDTEVKGEFISAYVQDDKGFVSLVLPYLTKAATAAASTLGSTVGSKVATAITPHILNFLGLQQEVTLAAINENITQLGKQLSDLSNQLSSSTATLLNEMSNNAFDDSLTNYNSEYNKLILFALWAYGDGGGLGKLLKMEKDVAGSDGKISDEELAKLLEDSEYIAAQEAFIANFEKNYNIPFLSDIKTFGDNLTSKAVGVGTGYCKAFWGLVQGSYLWDVQTIELKEQFLNTSATAYCLSMSAAIRYLNLKNDTSMLSTLVGSFDFNSKIIENYMKNLDDSMSRKRNNKTLEYSTGKTVSLTLNTYKADKDNNKTTDLSGECNIKFPYENYLAKADFDKILDAARTKKIDFLRSLRDAGFYGAPKSTEKEVRFGMEYSQSYQEFSTPISSRGFSRPAQFYSGSTSSYHISYITCTGNSVSDTNTTTYAKLSRYRERNIKSLIYYDTDNTYYYFMQ